MDACLKVRGQFNETAARHSYAADLREVAIAVAAAAAGKLA
jgi:hypothetical protein